MSNHTPEPWYIANYDATMIYGEKLPPEVSKWICQTNTTTFSARNLAGENARRIVASVNACALFETKDLEDGIINRTFGQNHTFDYERQLFASQRDELKAIIEKQKQFVLESFPEAYAEFCLISEGGAV
jgi:predicted lipase